MINVNIGKAKMKIKSIKKREERIFTVDIEVEDTHTYQLSNGAVSHNTVSLLNNTASGLHTRFSEYYIRRVRVNRTDPLCKMLMDQGLPWDPENGEEISNYQTAVFKFPVKSPDNSVCNNNIDAIEMLEYWKMLKVHWCEHNPSCTIFVKDDEWIKVGNWVYDNWNKIGGLSFLPTENMAYTLPPYEKITSDIFEQLVKEMPIIDFSQLTAYELEDETEGSTEFACSGGSCEIR